ncbi:glycosyltransferase family 61 protein [Pseudomonas sp. GD03862]|uniref:glycosyltransferase family 61 protein n=1 Tax=Pseudomonas sp. GD03862 TaxID=2975391 RepID=UPI0024474504|nr:glycosyltransferase family 61 protein [Pseudomonas sp. GD03862]MDH0707727.1 glycosyltransferase family 61 protein [Pseudomonas sp. GD03862]
MAVFESVNKFTGARADNFLPKLEYIYKSPASILGEVANTPRVTLDKLAREKIVLPEVNINYVEGATIVGDRLVVSGEEALNASFLNKRVAHEAAVKRAKDQTVDIDDKYLRKEFPVEEVGEALWLCGQYGSYQHWFTETLPVIWAYKANNIDLGAVKVIVGNDIKNYQQAILLQLGIAEENIIKKNKLCNLRVKSLAVSDNLSLNSFWVRPEIKDAYKFIFSSYIEQPSVKKFSEKIVLGRKQLGNVRQVFNFDLLERRLLDRGYEVVYPEDMSFGDKVNCFRSAREIVSLSGGGLCNLIFCEPGAKVMAISPDSFPINTFRDFSDIYDLNITYCLARSFLRYDDINLNANSFLTNELVNDIALGRWQKND